jgi:hypothetical protein
MGHIKKNHILLIQARLTVNIAHTHQTSYVLLHSLKLSIYL